MAPSMPFVFSIMGSSIGEGRLGHSPPNQEAGTWWDTMSQHTVSRSFLTNWHDRPRSAVGSSFEHLFCLRTLLTPISPVVTFPSFN